MSSNTSGALLVAILAVAGLVWGSPIAVWACIATCALAYLAEQLREAPADADGVEGFDTDAIAGVLALLSWLTVIVAALALMF